jgi:hypothetical protein
VGKRSRVWRWYDTPMYAKCKGCRKRWANQWTIYREPKCPHCGFTPEDAREQERQDRARERQRRTAEDPHAAR